MGTTTFSWTLNMETIVLLLVACMNAATLFYSRRTEKNTNSMKDALVLRTGEAAHAVGKAEGVLEGRIRAEEANRRSKGEYHAARIEGADPRDVRS